MTLFNYLLTDEAVYLLTDTVVCDPDDLSAITFTSKVHPFPHLEALVCGTGHVQLIIEWAATVNLALLVRDVVELDRFAPTRLRALFARHANEHGDGRQVTTTLYHFGYHRMSRRFVGFAYRSTDDFRSEPLPDGFAFKPAPEWSFDAARITKLPDHFITLAKRQKTQDEATDPAKRVMIGGQLIFHLMQRVPGPRNTGTVQTSAAICHSFPDFEEMYAAAAAKMAPG
jgi:hypothetical protein